jgi:hypothetical protein
MKTGTTTFTNRLANIVAHLQARFAAFVLEVLLHILHRMGCKTTMREGVNVCAAWVTCQRTLYGLMP